MRASTFTRTVAALLAVLIGPFVAAFAAAQDTPSRPRQQPTQSTSSDVTVADLLTKAEHGDAGAQLSLAAAYDFGLSVPQDYAQAAAWYRKAADQGMASAQVLVGVAYAEGQGVPQDYVEAHKWRNLAAARASAETQKEYAESRDALAKLMTTQQVAEAQKRAGEWLAAFEKRTK